MSDSTKNIDGALTIRIPIKTIASWEAEAKELGFFRDKKKTKPNFSKFIREKMKTADKPLLEKIEAEHDEKINQLMAESDKKIRELEHDISTLKKTAETSFDYQKLIKCLKRDLNMEKLSREQQKEKEKIEALGMDYDEYLEEAQVELERQEQHDEDMSILEKIYLLNAQQQKKIKSLVNYSGISLKDAYQSVMGDKNG